MILTCERCENEFESPTFVGYCPDCRQWFAEGRQIASDMANPRPGVHATGKFLPEDRCPKTVTDPVNRRQACGLCGGTDLEPGYGFAVGLGLGAYNFCTGCNAVLDFSEDSGE